jgi:hypothetical protein
MLHPIKPINQFDWAKVIDDLRNQFPAVVHGGFLLPAKSPYFAWGRGRSILNKNLELIMDSQSLAQKGIISSI